MLTKALADELELLAQIAQGDQLAFKKIYDAYFERTYTFAFHVLHEKEPAQEVVQEAMLHIWQLGDRLLGIRDLQGYLKTLAKRKAIDLLRKMALDKKTAQQATGSWSEGHEQTEEAIALNETRKILENGIQALPPQQRLVYQLCHQQGLKYEQAAQQLGIAPATVHRHMKLALKFLRQYLKQHGEMGIFLILFKLL